MAETQHQTSYTYTPSSAQSTRQLLDSTSPSSATKPNDVVFRPQNFTRKSSNYAEADARSRAAHVGSTDASSIAKNGAGGGRMEFEDSKSGAAPGGSASWKPKVGRKQSWSQQDLKRAMQMSSVGEKVALGPGFTEVQK